MNKYTDFLRELAIQETELPQDVQTKIEAHKRLEKAVKTQNIKDKIVASNEELINLICEIAYSKNKDEMNQEDIDAPKELKTEVAKHIQKKKLFGGVGIWKFL